MRTEQIVDLLINGQTVSIIDDNQAKEVRKRLREIKKNCSVVLSQMKEMNL